MQERCKTLSKMKWFVCDARYMTIFTDEQFNIIIDKGTIDAIMCEQGDVWVVEEKLASQIDLVCKEISRILKPGGTFIYISFGQPHFRKPLLDHPEYNWTYKVITIGDFFHYFVYLLNKKKE